MKETVFFLGANSYKGFYSLYSDFPGGGEFLHIIKGGPGTGKSGYMKAIYERAKLEDMDTERILCSGDPDSLDALSIPQLSRAWADGTSPHVLEPECYGVSGNYVNIGRFCTTPLNDADSRSASVLTREYKLCYERAYNWLKAAKQHEKCSEYGDNREELTENMQYIDGFAQPAGIKQGSLRRRFISAESCLGHIFLKETLETLCKQVRTVTQPQTLRTLAEYARLRGLDVIACPKPREPEILEAVLVPSIGTGFVSPGVPEGEETGRLCGCGVVLRPKYSCSAEDEFMELSWDSLRKAKHVHDELEKLYRQYMNFAALTDVTKKNIEKLFA